MRAEEVLKQLEQSTDNTQVAHRGDVSEIGKKREGMQLSFFQLDDPILEQIRDEVKHLDINSLTPLEALNKLNEIQTLVGGR